MGHPKADTIATFDHLLAELSARSIAFVEISQYAAFLDPLNRGVKDLNPLTEIVLHSVVRSSPRRATTSTRVRVR